MASLEKQIVFESDDFLIFNKPCGLCVQDDAGKPGLIRLLQDIRGTQALFPVHRLDKATSGLLIIAKSSEANSLLSTSFARREVEKYYWAISDRKPAKKQGSISGDMAKARGGSWKLMRSQDNPARTHFFSFALGEGLRAFLLKPYTGKTHQLRVALKSLGAAILGDERYGGSQSDRLYLHAACLRFSFKAQLYRFNLPPNGGEHFLMPEFKTLSQNKKILDNLRWPKQ